MSMEKLLRKANIRTAAVIDDVYDEMPRAEDIAESAGWASFLDDLGDDRELVRAKFPAFDELDADELRHSNGFVEAIWALKGELPQPLWDTLFDDYVRALESDRKFLGKV
ncbi:hypothetical protein EBA17_01135 [Xanthomonas oryzae pv. oryzae]|uniref:hypothetical protein n=1 Tax=Xanthomonas oryzae TaxID=347 RepID=UPI001058940D|nr:hypothetical protein [Xanthomonas oryzae]QBN85521.1 hypothetical protein EBA17_01135 [Xanthomonas oryzae pv. oryzae]